MSSDAGRYARIRAVFVAALDRPTAERAAFVEEKCGGDPDLAKEVMSLLERIDSAGEMTQTPMGRAIRARIDAVANDAEAGAGRAAELPSRIGPYEVVRCIGEGGMGVVYEATQQVPRRRVAVKVMRPGQWTSSLVARFRREAELLGRLQHPGIARVYEAGEDRHWGADGPKLPYLVMELVEGVPITAHAARRGLGVDARLELIAKTCDAVQHAHERGVVHRDIKPANVLVDEAGQPRVLDFGVARGLDGEGGATMNTGTSQLVGTLPYMSPEQVNGRSQDIGPASDVYALGVLCYELLTGRLPLPLAGLSLVEASRQVLEVDPPRPGALDPRLAGDVDAILDKALSKEPWRRYGSAAEMAADIRRHLAEQPIQARPASAIYRARKFVRRNRTFVAATAGVVIALAAGVVATSWLAVSEARARSEAVQAAMAAEAASYRAELAAALAAISEGDATTARAHLERTAPVRREWTWRHATARLDDAVAVVDLEARGESSAAEIAPTSDGRLVVRHGEDVSILAFDGDQPRVERRVAGAFLAVARDGRRGVARQDGSLSLVDLLAPDAPRRELGPEGGDPEVLPLPGGGFAVVAATVYSIRPDGSVGPPLEDAPLEGLEALLAGSPDGRFLVGSHSEKAALWDLETGRLAGTCEGSVRTAVFAPNGRLVYVGRHSGHVSALRVPSLLPGPWVDRKVSAQTPVERVDLSPDGRTLLSIDLLGEARAWRTSDAAPLADVASLGFVRHVVAFGPSGRHVALPDVLGRLRVVGLDGRAVGRSLLAGGHAAVAMAWLADRGLIVTISQNGVAAFFAVPGQHDPRILSGHESYVYAVDVSPDGRTIASAAWDATARTWDLARGEALGTFPLASQYGRALKWMPDGRSIVVAASTQLVRIDVATGATLGRHDAGAGGGEIAVDPLRGDVYYTSETTALASWSPSTGAVRIVRDSVSEDRGRIAMSPDASMVAHVVAGGTELVSIPGGELVALLPTPVGQTDHEVKAGETLALAFDGSSATLAQGLRSGDVVLWDVATARKTNVLPVPGGNPVLSLAFHPGAPLLAVGSKDALITTWQLPEGTLVGRLRGHVDYIRGLAFSPDGTALVSASGDGTVRVWDTVPLAERWRRAVRPGAAGQATGG